MRRRELIAMSMLAAVATAGCPYILGVESEFKTTTGAGGADGGTEGAGAGGPGGGSPGAGGMGGAGGATTTTGPGGGGGQGGGGIGAVDHIAVNGSHVYWIANPETEQAEVRRQPKAGGAPEPILTQDDLKDLAVNDDVLIAASPNYVYRLPLPGSGTTTEQTWDGADIGAVTLTDSKIYYAEGLIIRHASHSSTAPAQFEPEDFLVTDLAAGPNFVYWTIEQGAKRLPHGQGSSNTFMTDPGLRIAVEGETACWTTEETGLVHCWSSGNATPHDVPTTAGVPPTAIAVAGGYVYWTEISTGRVARALVTGAGTPEDLATNQQDPSSIAVDNTGVYWTNRTAGEVMSAPLP